MSLYARDWRYSYAKSCFAPCPPGMYCECSERMKWEISYEGREWLREQKELAEKQTQRSKEYDDFKDIFEGI